MGDYYWYGCSGQKDSTKASDYYAEAARKHDPQVGKIQCLYSVHSRHLKVENHPTRQNNTLVL